MHARTTKEQQRPTIIEPATVAERQASEFIGVSQRTFRNLITRGDITPIRIPGIRRIVFDVADLRALLSKWKQPSSVA